jgi:hypothetical protein
MNERTGAIQQLRQELVTALLAIPEEDWGRIMEIGQAIVVLAEHLSKIKEREKRV